MRSPLRLLLAAISSVMLAVPVQAVTVAITFNRGPAVYQPGDHVEMHIDATGTVPRTFLTVTISGRGLTDVRQLPALDGQQPVFLTVGADARGAYTVTVRYGPTDEEATATYTVEAL